MNTTPSRVLRTGRILTAAVALLLALPSLSLAQGKIKVAIWEFENHADTGYWYYNEHGTGGAESD